jgi:hypothetical protein
MRKRRKSIITCSSLAQSQIELLRYADADAPQRPPNQVKQLLRIYDTHFQFRRSKQDCLLDEQRHLISARSRSASLRRLESGLRQRARQNKKVQQYELAKRSI